MKNRENPWKTLSSRLIYQNPWIQLREDKVIRPDGLDGIYSVVDTRIAVGIVAVTPQNEIYLVGQWRYPLNAYSWEIIEGGSDSGEDPSATAHRELREEAGLIAGKLEIFGPDVHLSNCFTSERAVFYLAQDLKLTEAEPEGTEVLEVRKVKFEEVFTMVERGEITDAMSVIAINRLAKKFQK